MHALVCAWHEEPPMPLATPQLSPHVAPPAPVPAAADRVGFACAACLPAHQHDCSGFVHAVAATLDVTIAGLADEMVDLLRHGGAWRPLADGPAAVVAAAAGQLVVAGLNGTEQAVPDAHGHVVVVVPGPLAHGRYPSAWWGSLGGTPGHGQTLNWAWTEADRDHVSYAAHVLPAPAPAPAHAAGTA